MGALKISYQLVKVLKEKFGEQQAESIALCIESAIDERFDSTKETMASKKDIYELSEKVGKDINNLSEKVNKDLNQLSIKVNKDLNDLSIKVNKDINDLSEKVNKSIFEISDRLGSKIDSHIKWMIGLILGQMVFIIGIVYFVLNYHK